MRVLWTLVVIFSALAFCAVILANYAELSTLYYKGYDEPTTLSESLLALHAAEIAQYRDEFMVGVFGVVSQLGLYVSLLLVSLHQSRKS